MRVLRFENSEDINDKNITEMQFNRLQELENKHGFPLDLFRFDQTFWQELFDLPDLEFDKDRKYDFSIILY